LIDVGGELPRSIRATSSDSCDHEQLLREVGDLSYVRLMTTARRVSAGSSGPDLASVSSSAMPT
jgi:hypothetical protein